MGIDLRKHQGIGESLKAKDIVEDKITITVKDIGEDSFEDGDSLYLIVDVQGTEITDKKFYMNVTNTNRMKTLHGDNTDEWKGKTVKMHKVMATHAKTKKEVPALRITEE